MPLQDSINKYYLIDDPNAVLDWDVFDEYVVVTGATGTGKTTLVINEIVPKLQGVAYWILDPKMKFSNCGKVVHDMEQLDTNYQYVFQPRDTGMDMFKSFCNKVLQQNNLHVIIDEAHLWLTKQSMIREHYDIINTKRNDGVTHTHISTSTKAIPNYLLGNITHVYSLRYNLRGDIDWVADYVGDHAEFLLPSDKRMKIDTGIPREDGKGNYTFKDLPMLKEYAFVYRDLRRRSASIIGGFEDA